MLPGMQPDPEVAGLFSVRRSERLCNLFRPRHAWIGFVLGRGFSRNAGEGLWSCSAHPLVMTAPLVALGLAATARLATNTPGVFTGAALREEALLIVCALGLGVAVLPSVLDGWQAAAESERANGERRAAGDSGVGAVCRRRVGAARRSVCRVDSAVNLLPVLENGLFALGQVLRFPGVRAPLGVRDLAPSSWPASCAWTSSRAGASAAGSASAPGCESGPVLAGLRARVQLLPASLRQCSHDVVEARGESALGRWRPRTSRARTRGAAASSAERCAPSGACRSEPGADRHAHSRWVRRWRRWRRAIWKPWRGKWSWR